MRTGQAEKEWKDSEGKRGGGRWPASASEGFGVGGYCAQRHGGAIEDSGCARFQQLRAAVLI